MSNDYNNRERKNVVGGLLLILGGSLFLGYKLGLPIPVWLFSWEVLLIALGLYSGLKNNFRGPGWFILMAVGACFLLDRQMPELNLHNYIAPIAVIGAGILILFRPKDGWNKDRWKKKSWDNGLSEKTNATDFEIDRSDFIQIRSIFSGVEKSILSKNFQGGSISCIFGGAELDLSKADFTGTVVINIEEIFGGCTMVIPPTWTLQNEIHGVFHGIDDKRSFGNITNDPNKILVLKGSAVFAGIDIRSY